VDKNLFSQDRLYGHARPIKIGERDREERGIFRVQSVAALGEILSSI
jgi:hypothetical protein